MRRNRAALLLPLLLAACSDNSRRELRVTDDFVPLTIIAYPAEAYKLAARDHKPILYFAMPGKSEEAWTEESAWFVLRTLQDESVRRRLSGSFVLTWSRENGPYAHTGHVPERVLHPPSTRPAHDPSQAPILVFATPSGEVRAVLTEALDTAEFLRQLDWIERVLAAPTLEEARGLRIDARARTAEAAGQAGRTGHHGPPEKCPCEACVLARVAAGWGDTAAIGRPLVDPDPFGEKR